jgi:hypothetical protein
MDVIYVLVYTRESNVAIGDYENRDYENRYMNRIPYQVVVVPISKVYFVMYISNIIKISQYCETRSGSNSC